MLALGRRTRIAAYVVLSLVGGDLAATAQDGSVDRAISELTEAAADGSIEAMVDLGQAYDLGIVVDRNIPEAKRLLQLAAEAGDPAGQTMLGRLYFGRPGLERDESEAFRWFSLAADQGYPRAIGLLAECYRLGMGVAEDRKRAVKLRAEALAAGDGYSAYLEYNFTSGALEENQRRLDYGDATTVAEAKAEIARLVPKMRAYLLFAADRGVAPAQYILAQVLESGRNGFPQDHDAAMTWLVRAAQGGDFYAQYLLGVRYRNGDGVERDKALGDQWLALAARNGHPDAADILADADVQSVDVPASAVLLGMVAAVFVSSLISESNAAEGDPNPYDELPDINDPCYVKDYMSDEERVMNACY